MAKPIEISLVANTRAFIAGTKDASEALGDVSESLDDLVRDSQKQGDKTGDNLKAGVKDGTEDAKTYVEKLERSFRELATEARSESRKAGDDIGKNVKRGTDEGVDAVQEFKDEAKANLSETVSSFDGSVESLAEGLQGTLGGVAANLGPAGLVGAGILGAVVGVATQSVVEWDEAQAEISQGFADMYAAAAEDGRNYLTETEVLTQAASLLGDPEKQKELKRDAETLGVSLRDLALAQAGDQDALNAVLDITKQKQTDILNGKIETGKRVEYELRDLGSVEGRYGRINELNAEQKKIGQDILALTNEAKAAEERRAGAAVAGIDLQGQRLQALADRGIPDKKINVDVDTSAAETKLQNFLSKRRNEIAIGVRYANGKAVLE